MVCRFTYTSFQASDFLYIIPLVNGKSIETTFYVGKTSDGKNVPTQTSLSSKLFILNVYFP